MTGAFSLVLDVEQGVGETAAKHLTGLQMRTQPLKNNNNIIPHQLAYGLLTVAVSGMVVRCRFALYVTFVSGCLQQR